MLTLSTKVDTSGIRLFEKQMNSTSAKLQTRLEKAQNKVKTLEAEIKETTQALEKLENPDTKVKSTAIDEITKKINHLRKLIKEYNAEMLKAFGKQDYIARTFGSVVDGELVLPPSKQVEYNALNEKIDELELKMKEAQAEADKLAQSIDSVGGSERQTQIDKLKAKIEELQLKLKEAQIDAQITKDEVEEAASSGSLLGQLGDSFKGVGKKIASAIKRLLLFQLVYSTLREIVDEFKKILKANEELQQDFAELKAALYAVAQPLVDILVPAIQYVVGVVRDWAVSLGKLIAMAKGITYTEFIEAAKATKDAADNVEAIEESVENTSKMLAAFDDLQILTSNAKESASESDEIDGFESLKKYDTSGETSMLENLGIAIAGALVAIGLILLFNGQIAWGLGFIIAGAWLYTVTQAWTSEYAGDEERGLLNKISSVVSTSLIALGLILLVSGKIGWGLGFIIAGAAIRHIKEIWTSEYAGDDVQALITKISLTVATALIAIGLILLVAGQIGWGLALIVVGAIDYADEKLKEKYGFAEGKVNSTLRIIRGIAFALLWVIGVILICTGVAMPLGIGLALLGLSKMAEEVYVNWDTISNKIDEVFDEWGVIIAVVGVVAIALGILLCCTGVMFGLGLGLIALGAAAFAKELSANSKEITNFFDELGSSFKTWWKNAFSNFWKGEGEDAGESFFEAFASKGKDAIPDSISSTVLFGDGKYKYIGGTGTSLSSYSADSSTATFKVPALAEGRVIPANREFLALLGDQKSGTNIEAPADLIKQMVVEALSERGNGGTMEVVLEIDGREFGRAVVEQGNRENRRVGTRLVVV